MPESPVRVANVNAGTSRRLIDDRIQPSPDGVVLNDVAEHLPVDLVVALRPIQAEVLDHHVVPHWEEVRRLRAQSLEAVTHGFGFLTSAGDKTRHGLHVNQPSPQADRRRPSPGPGIERKVLLAQQTQEVAPFAGRLEQRCGLRPVAQPR